MRHSVDLSLSGTPLRDPDLTVEREVTRDGNLLDVTLVVRNAGTLPAWLKSVDDNINGMIPLYQNAPGHRTLHSGSFWVNNNQRREHLTFDLKAAAGARLKLEPRRQLHHDLQRRPHPLRPGVQCRHRHRAGENHRQRPGQ